MVFIAGTEELLLIERGGNCRIFSLVTENFRSAFICTSILFPYFLLDHRLCTWKAMCAKHSHRQMVHASFYNSMRTKPLVSCATTGLHLVPATGSTLHGLQMYLSMLKWPYPPLGIEIAPISSLWSENFVLVSPFESASPEGRASLLFGRL